MVSDSKKFIFIHCAKTAGDSITIALQHHCHDHITWKRQGTDIDVWHPKYNVGKHFSAKMIRDKVGSEKYNEYFKFSCIRNPWDRLLSLYFYGEKVWDRDIFIKKIQQSYKTYSFKKEQAFSKMLFINGELSVDYLIRFENLQSDFNIVCNTIGIGKVSLPSVNKSSHAHYTRYYDYELVNLVYEFYKEDIDYFGYKFGQ